MFWRSADQIGEKAGTALLDDYNKLVLANASLNEDDVDEANTIRHDANLSTDDETSADDDEDRWAGGEVDTTNPRASKKRKKAAPSTSRRRKPDADAKKSTAREKDEPSVVRKAILGKKALAYIQKMLDDTPCPRDVGHIPRKVSSSFAQLTSSELLTIATIYLYPAMQRLLDAASSSSHLRPQHLELVRLVREASLILRSNVITREQIDELATMQKEILAMISNPLLYGPEVIKPNLHLLGHMPSVLADYGPANQVWCNAFERMNGLLKKQSFSHSSVEIGVMSGFQTLFQISNRIATCELLPNSVSADRLHLLRQVHKLLHGTQQTIGGQAEQTDVVSQQVRYTRTGRAQHVYRWRGLNYKQFVDQYHSVNTPTSRLHMKGCESFPGVLFNSATNAATHIKTPGPSCSMRHQCQGDRLAFEHCQLLPQLLKAHYARVYADAIGCAIGLVGDRRAESLLPHLDELTDDIRTFSQLFLAGDRYGSANHSSASSSYVAVMYDGYFYGQVICYLEHDWRDPVSRTGDWRTNSDRQLEHHTAVCNQPLRKHSFAFIRWFEMVPSFFKAKAKDKTNKQEEFPVLFKDLYKNQIANTPCRFSIEPIPRIAYRFIPSPIVHRTVEWHVQPNQISSSVKRGDTFQAFPVPKHTHASRILAL